MIQGIVERRLLVNYRADPEVVMPLLPSMLRPQLVDDAAVVGICLIRLGALRPRGWPEWLGLRSENAAHRIAVEWDDDTGRHVGVFIPRRDSSALTNVAIGGRLYPGVHHWADFRVVETPTALRVAFTARDGMAQVDVDVDAGPCVDFGSELFRGLKEASDFFRTGSAGFSPGRDACTLEGLELQTDVWTVEPVAVRTARSTFFDDLVRFPRGSLRLDCALLMRNVPVRWRPLPSLHASRADVRTLGRVHRRIS